MYKNVSHKDRQNKASKVHSGIARRKADVAKVNSEHHRSHNEFPNTKNHTKEKEKEEQKKTKLVPPTRIERRAQIRKEEAFERHTLIIERKVQEAGGKKVKEVRKEKEERKAQEEKQAPEVKKEEEKTSPDYWEINFEGYNTFWLPFSILVGCLASLIIYLCDGTFFRLFALVIPALSAITLFVFIAIALVFYFKSKNYKNSDYMEHYTNRTSVAARNRLKLPTLAYRVAHLAGGFIFQILFFLHFDVLYFIFRVDILSFSFWDLILFVLKNLLNEVFWASSSTGLIIMWFIAYFPAIAWDYFRIKPNEESTKEIRSHCLVSIIAASIYFMFFAFIFIYFSILT